MGFNFTVRHFSYVYLLITKYCVRKAERALGKAIDNFTLQELEILKWVALGNSDCQISKLLEVSSGEVVNAIDSAGKKLAANNRVDIALKAITLGLV